LKRIIPVKTALTETNLDVEKNIHFRQF